MIWNAKAVNRGSKCNPGSQPFWFEKSRPLFNGKACLVILLWRKLVGVLPVMKSIRLTALTSL